VSEDPNIAAAPSDAGTEYTLDSESSDGRPAHDPTAVEEKETDEYFWYEFIGESYVHSMMDGEAIKYQNQHEIKPRIFELR
jgi:hypothetical protein